MRNQLDVLMCAAIAVDLPLEYVAGWYHDLQQWEKHVGLYKSEPASIEEVCNAAIALGERIDGGEMTDEDEYYVARAITIQIPLRRIIGKLTQRIVAMENGLNNGRHN